MSSALEAEEQPALGNSALVGVPVRSGVSTLRRLQNFTFGSFAASAGILVLITILVIGIRLFLASELCRRTFGWGFLSASVWDVPHEKLGALPFIYGTIVSSLVAIVISVPISVGAAIFLNEMGIGPWAKPIRYFMELLAAIPSVIYGMWAFLVLCPWLKASVAPWLSKNVGFLPLFQDTPDLTNMLAAGVILAIMISPFIISVVTEVFRSLPSGLREASLALGANRWETVRSVVLPASRGGIVAAVMLGLGRALGETMAVVMVIGNTVQIKASLLKAGYSMPALLANQFGESYSDPLQLSSLLEIAFLLFVLTVVINGLARGLVRLTSLGGLDPSAHPLKRWLNQIVQWSISSLGSVVGAMLVLAFAYQLALDVHDHGLAFVGRPAFIGICLAASGVFIRTVRMSQKWVDRIRKVNQAVSLAACLYAGFLACAVLAIILGYIGVRGGKGLSINVLTALPRPAGMPGGGLKNAVFGTVQLVGIAALIGVPIGILGGVFLAEYKTSRLRAPVRFAADLLGGIPSVVIGLFAYAMFVLPFHHFSALAGSFALAIMMIPTVMRITEEILRLVPDALREASHGLGATRAETIFKVVMPAAKAGIVTGVMLAVARISGETAPLLFTAFGSDLISWDPREPVSSLTMQIYKFAAAPYDDWVSLAWSGALVLVVMVLAVSLLARFVAAQTGSRFAAFRRA